MPLAVALRAKLLSEWSSLYCGQEAGYCSIEYTADTFKVSMGLSGAPVPAPTTVSTASKVGLTTCSTVDYVYIPLGQARTQ